MNKLLEDRRLLLPTIVTALVIAIGASLIILLAGEDDGGGGESASSSSSAPAAPSGGGAAQGGVVKVTISDFAFEPEEVTVKSGAEVEWVNQDEAPHNARGDGGIDTKNLTKGQSEAVKLTETGTFDYICSLHPFMKGKVTVE